MIQEIDQKKFFTKYRRWLVGGATVLVALVAALILLYLFVLRGNVQVTNLSLSSEQIVSGEKVQAAITVENKGLFTAHYTGNMTIDGKQQSLGGMDVKHSAPQAVSYDLSALGPGQHTIQISGFSRHLKVLKPAYFTVTGLVLSSNSILTGGTITAKATITNSGEVDGTYTPKFTYDGSAVDYLPVTIKPGASETVEVKVPVQASGAHEIRLDGQKQAFTALKPTKIKIVDLKLSEQYARTNESVSFTVTLQNTGDVAGTYQLPLLVNGKAASTQSISVGANTKLVSTFMLVEGSAGRYVLGAGGFSKALYVVDTIRPENGTLLVNKANSGSGKLTLVNGDQSQDAVFVLTSTSDMKTPLLTIYVHMGSKAANIKITDGEYYVFYATGTGYESAAKRFLKPSSMKRLTAPLSFKTTRSGHRTHGSKCSVSLDATGGSTSAVQVPDANFPR